MTTIRHSSYGVAGSGGKIFVNLKQLQIGIWRLQSLLEDRSAHLALERVREIAPRVSSGGYAESASETVTELEFIEAQIDRIIELTIEMLQNAQRDYAAADQGIATALNSASLSTSVK
jgi:hypothetical protein